MSAPAVDESDPAMGVPRDVLRSDPGLSQWCILHGWRGSIAHGMYVPSSSPDSIDDKDTMAICVPPASYYVSLDEYGSRGTVEIKHGEWDVVVYEARKAISLLRAGNPNILSLLWLPENLYLLRAQPGRILLENRDAFVGRHVYKSFVGYAKSQLSKMTNQAYEGYMGEKRKRLVDQHGYDTKNAAHLVRLLRMGIEFLIDGELIVDRGGYDATELLDIKHGSWSLGEIQKLAAKLFDRAEEAYLRSTLPAKPDDGRIRELCAEVVLAELTGRGEL